MFIVNTKTMYDLYDLYCYYPAQFLIHSGIFLSLCYWVKCIYIQFRISWPIFISEKFTFSVCYLQQVFALFMKTLGKPIFSFLSFLSFFVLLRKNRNGKRFIMFFKGLGQFAMPFPHPPKKKKPNFFLV